MEQKISKPNEQTMEALRVKLELWELVAEDINVLSIVFANNWKFKYDPYWHRHTPKAYFKESNRWVRKI